MKTPYKDIYTVLGTNRLIVIGSLVVTFLTIIFSLFFTSQMYNKSINSSFAINLDGSVLPIQLQETKESFDIEVMHHLDIFHRFFYDINANDYESQTDKALWLGNESIDQLYRQKQADQVYNKIVQFNLAQKVIDIKSKIHTTSLPMHFRTVVTFEVYRGNTIDTYELITKGNIIKIARDYPHNPHGLLITNYFEEQLKKVENESR